MARTQEQREKEFADRKVAVLQEINDAQTRLEDAEQTLLNKYFPSEKKFQNWAFAVHAADPKRVINAREFMKDFYKELLDAMEANKELLGKGDRIIKEWETWFQGLDKEDLASLESQMDQAGVAQSTLPRI